MKNLTNYICSSFQLTKIGYLTEFLFSGIEKYSTLLYKDGKQVIANKLTLSPNDGRSVYQNICEKTAHFSAFTTICNFHLSQHISIYLSAASGYFVELEH